MKSQPTGLWFISAASFLICIGFGGINSQLVIYAHTLLHMGSAKFYPLSATYNALLFAFPLVGGYVSEKVGFQRALLMGTACCALGLITMAFPTLIDLYVGLAAFAVGICLVVPSYLVLLGKLYAKVDKRRESGFTIAYAIMNMGFFTVIVFGSYLIQYAGYQIAYLLYAAIALLIYVLYYFCRHTLTPYGQRSIEPLLKWSKPALWSLLAAVSLVLFFLAIWLLQHPSETTAILMAIIALVTIALIMRAKQQPQAIARKRLYAFLILSYLSISFWALYTLEPALLTVFIENNVDRLLFNSTIPAAAYYSLDAIFVIVIGAFLGWLWHRLEARNISPSLPAKFSGALLIMGLGILILPLAIYLTGDANKINMFWIVLVYLFLAAAELLIGPVGQSMVGRLAPEGMEGTLMGCWQLFTGFAGALSAYLDKLAITPSNATLSVSNPIYVDAFIKIGGITFIVGIFSLFFVRYLKRMIN